MLDFALAALTTTVLEWGDLPSEDAFELQQEITLGGAKFAEGSRFRYEGQLSIPGLNTFMIETRAADCPNPEATADLEWIAPKSHEGTRPPRKRVGVELQKNCLFVSYVEFVDYYAASYFRPLK